MTDDESVVLGFVELHVPFSRLFLPCGRHGASAKTHQSKAVQDFGICPGPFGAVL